MYINAVGQYSFLKLFPLLVFFVPLHEYYPQHYAVTDS